MATPSIPTGVQIRDAREARGWTQDDLIKELVRHGYRSIGQPALSNIERFRPVPRFMRAPLLRALPELAEEPEGLAEAG